MKNWSARRGCGGAADRLRAALGCRQAPAARATYERALATARAQLDEATFDAAWAAGQALTLEEAIAYAMAHHYPQADQE